MWLFVRWGCLTLIELSSPVGSSQNFKNTMCLSFLSFPKHCLRKFLHEPMRFGQLYDWCHSDHNLDETRLQPKLHILNMKNKLPHTKPQQLRPNLESKWPSRTSCPVTWAVQYFYSGNTNINYLRDSCLSQVMPNIDIIGLIRIHMRYR